MREIKFVFAFMFVFFVKLTFCQSVRYQQSIQQPQRLPHTYYTKYYGTRILPNGHVQIVAPINSPQYSNMYNQNHNHMTEAEDRHLKWIKLLKWKKKKKFKMFKKHLKKCGFPKFKKFKIIKKSDDTGDDYDTIRIQIPLDDYEDDYFPRASGRSDKVNNTDSTESNENAGSDEDDDDDDSDDDDENDDKNEIITSPSSSSSKNQAPYNRMVYKIPHRFHTNRLMSPRYPFYHHYRPMTPTQAFLAPFRMVPRRPWRLRNSWRLARPGFYPMPYRLKEPIPGFVGGSPPAANLPQTSTEKHIPLHVKEEETPRTESGDSQTFRDSYNQYVVVPGHTAVSNPSSFNIRYSIPDYSVHGSYEVAQKINEEEFPSGDNIEKVVTVTPTSVWGTNPIYVNDDNLTKSEAARRTSDDRSHYLSSPRYDHVRKLSESGDYWVPVRQEDSTTMTNFVTYPPNQVNTPKSDLEIITAEYPLDITMNQDEDFDKSSKLSPPTTDDSSLKTYLEDYRVAGGDGDKTEPDYQIPMGNSSRIRRSGIENFSFLVSSSVKVRQS